MKKFNLFVAVCMIFVLFMSAMTVRAEPVEPPEYFTFLPSTMFASDVSVSGYIYLWDGNPAVNWVTRLGTVFYIDPETGDFYYYLSGGTSPAGLTGSDGYFYMGGFSEGQYVLLIYDPLGGDWWVLEEILEVYGPVDVGVIDLEEPGGEEISAVECEGDFCILRK